MTKSIGVVLVIPVQLTNVPDKDMLQHQFQGPGVGGRVEPKLAWVFARPGVRTSRVRAPDGIFVPSPCRAGSVPLRV